MEFMIMTGQLTRFNLTLTLAATLALAGCVDAPEELGEFAELSEASELEVSTPAQALVSGWTSFASEEDPPLVCDDPGVVAGFACTGDYCDNVSLDCQTIGLTGSASYWTSYVSEESTNYRFCNWRYWLTGVACSGDYCDNLSLQCRYYGDSEPRDCYWTGWMSEEHGGTLYFGAGYYARGLECRGDYCDNKRFYVCRP